MSGKELLCDLVAWLARLISGATPRLIGWEPSERCTVYFANHGSHLDAVVIWAMLAPKLRRRTHPVAARDYWQKSRSRRWLAHHVFSAILIDRHGVHSIAESLKTLWQALDKGDSLIIFPEGTRGDGLTVGRFKPGLHNLAEHRPDVDMVPVYLQNLNRILPKGEILPVPFLGSVSFGGVIHLQEGESREEFLKRARNALIALTEEPC